VELLDCLARHEAEGDRTLAEARTGDAVLHLERAEQLESVQDVLLDQELPEAPLPRRQGRELDDLRLHALTDGDPRGQSHEIDRAIEVNVNSPLWNPGSAFETPVDRAMAAGAAADRLGFAFAGGYTAALQALVPGLAEIAALCATEEGGNQPTAIKTTLANGELTGNKKWATGADRAATLLVVASIGQDAGRNRLRVVRVRTDAPGVTMRASSAPFVPEIQHAEVDLDHVRVADEDVLPGDGYDDYLKPFRTIEDTHVHAALAGYVFAIARRHGWKSIAERAAALALAAREVALADPKSPQTHVALAGVISLAAATVAEAETAWATAPDDEWQRWQRDRPLLQMAASARAARRERAWAILG
jgi:acyl-CoA dehydrogenase